MTRYEFGGRTEQHKASVHRMTDANKLRAAKRWKGAMYLAGYSIECGIKAKLMEKYRAGTLTELESRLSGKFGGSVDLKTHSIEYLFRFLGTPKMPVTIHDSQALRAYRRCNEWRVGWRYDPRDGTQDACDSFLTAVQVFSRFLDKSL